MHCFPRARLTLPPYLEAVDDDSGTRLIVQQTITIRTKLGPFAAKRFNANVNIADGFTLKVRVMLIIIISKFYDNCLVI